MKFVESQNDGLKLQKKLSLDYRYQFVNDPDKLPEPEKGSLIDPNDQKVIFDIKARYEKRLGLFEEYLSQKYMEMDHKINNCIMTRCFKDIYAPPPSVGLCRKTCSEGGNAFKEFIDNEANQLKIDLNMCVNKRQGNEGNEMSQIFQCYDELIKGVSRAAKNIEKESTYYV